MPEMQKNWGVTDFIFEQESPLGILTVKKYTERLILTAVKETKT